MASAILYLDIDDEITSVAARVRGATERRVAVVLPHLSRVATSRINFRLLARDALTHEKRLSIVASDAATRALAASAGLPIFASVAEYEAAQEPAGAPAPDAPTPPDASAAPDAPATSEGVPIGTTGAKRRKRGAGAAVSGAAAGGAAGSAVAGGVVAGEATGAAADITAAAAAPAAAPVPLPLAFDDAATAAVPAAGRAADLDAEVEGIPVPDAAPYRYDPAASRRPRPPMARPLAAQSGVRPESGGVTRWRAAWERVGRSSALIVVAVFALATLVGGVGAYLVLPTATVVVTPRDKPIGPLRMTITADPTATAPDAAARVVPAETVTVDVDATRTFPATGKRVEETLARGAVRFRNKDFTSSNQIPKGSIVSTQTGIRFRTAATVTVQPAKLVGLQIFPSTATVRITAVAPGPEGNVEPNTILVIPRGEDPLTLDVTNPDATKGGTRKEFPLVAEKDVTAAVAALTADLQAAFKTKLADPSLVADGATVFPDTGVLGAPVQSVDPTTLVGKQLATFDLSATASGTVTAVKTDAVQAVAEQRLAGSVEPRYQLVAGSGQIQTDPAVVSGGLISFPVVATAHQVAVLDPNEIRASIRGRSLEEAQTILQGFGRWDLKVWPDWVRTIPTLDARLDVRVAEPATMEIPPASASPEATP